LGLQRSFGGDIVATLDYPLPLRLNDTEAKERIGRSLDNCLETARLTKLSYERDFLVFMSVHGRTRIEARETVRHLLNRLRKGKFLDLPFGLAIGSLVPLSSSPLSVIDIVRGVYEGIRECEWLSPGEVPVHAFGVSSRMMPFLAALGVDTFDGSTYVQMAQQLKYVISPGFSIRPFLQLERLPCECRYCKSIVEGGLEKAKELLRGRSFGQVEFGGRQTNKSYIYSLLALHNLQASLDTLHRVRTAVGSNKGMEELFLEAARDARTRKTLAYLAKYFPQASDFLWEIGVSQLEKRELSRGNLSLPVPRSARIRGGTQHLMSSERTTVSLKLGPDDFDITLTNYHPPAKSIMLILPCSQQKPYASSPTHRFIKRALEEAGISSQVYLKVSISGNYGPVPEEFEEDLRIQSYDYYLSSTDTTRIDLISKRTRSFILRHGNRFKSIVAYCTAKAYREVLERALDGVPNSLLLPSPIRVRRQSQFRKPENLKQLTVALKHIIT